MRGLDVGRRATSASANMDSTFGFNGSFQNFVAAGDGGCGRVLATNEKCWTAVSVLAFAIRVLKDSLILMGF